MEQYNDPTEVKIPTSSKGAELTAHANEVRDYECHGTDFSSQGAMSLGGENGVDYQTTSVGDTSDADSACATG